MHQERHLLLFLGRAVRDELDDRRLGGGGRDSKLDIVKPGAVHVEKVDPVLHLLGLRVAGFRQPDIFRAQHLGIGADDLAHDPLAVERIGQLHINKTRRSGETETVTGCACGIGTCRKHGIAAVVGHLGIQTVGFVDSDGITILGQKVAHGVAPRQIHQHIVDQEMGGRPLEKRGQRAAQRVAVGEVGGECGELAGQRGFHYPAAHRASAGKHIAKIDV